jgi:hypothetical protein
MKRLKAGAVLLSIWCVLNALVALVVTVMTLAGRQAPALALMLRPADIAALDPRAIAVVNAQAAIANPLIVALCALVLIVTWTSARARARWAVPALATTLIPLQAFGFVSDAFLGDRNLAANVASTVMLLAALWLMRLGSRAVAPAGRPGDDASAT